MKTVTFGPGSDQESILPAIGFGCMGLSWAYVDDSVPPEERVAVLKSAADSGVRLFDTSDQYGPFTNEVLVGEALHSHREDVFLATKGGLVVDAAMRTTRDGSPEHLHAALAASRQRLGTDQVDLYQLHRVDPQVPLERSWEALAAEVAAGHARHIGLSEVSVDEIRRAQRIHPVASVQSELSLWSREALEDVVPYCAEHGIVFIAYAPLGRGFLTGAITAEADLDGSDMRVMNERFQAAAIAANTRDLLGPMRECSQALHVSMAQVALAWVLAQADNIAVIPGTKHLKYLRDNLAAAELRLPDEWLARLDAAQTVHGVRY
jgi:aryl-alcohol dehydrogenase-like predicted oxidoreductase